MSTYLPGEPISAEYYAQFADSDDLRDNLMFRAPKFRHHVAKDETAIDMVERAAAGLIERHGQDAIANVDVLITHTQLPDMPFYGGGGGMAHRLGMKPNWVLDLHNGGCAAFVLGLKVARNLLASGRRADRADRRRAERGREGLRPADGAPQGAGVGARRRRRRRAGHAVGRIADPRRRMPHVRRVRRRHDRRCRPAAQVVAAGPGELHIGFTESKITKVLARGNRQVPEVAYAVCDRIGMQPKDLDLLVTNQPNRVFLRNWREALELPKERHVDTFDDCGNLFAAGIPINLDRAISDGTLKKGDVVMMAAFAHAGDFAGAAAIKWGGRD